MFCDFRIILVVFRTNCESQQNVTKNSNTENFRTKLHKFSENSQFWRIGGSGWPNLFQDIRIYRCSRSRRSKIAVPGGIAYQRVKCIDECHRVVSEDKVHIPPRARPASFAMQLYSLPPSTVHRGSQFTHENECVSNIYLQRFSKTRFCFNVYFCLKYDFLAFQNTLILTKWCQKSA